LDRIAIIGGARLNGIIPVSGAKNSAIKLMAASLLTDEPLRLTNMPRLADTKFLGRLLRELGVRSGDQLLVPRATMTREDWLLLLQIASVGVGILILLGVGR